MKSLFTKEGLLWINVVENQSYLKKILVRGWGGRFKNTFLTLDHGRLDGQLDAWTEVTTYKILFFFNFVNITQKLQVVINKYL